MEKEQVEKIAAVIKQADANITATKIKSASVSIQVHRAATNTVEDFGVVSSYHSNPIIHAYQQIGIWLRSKKRLWPQFLQTKAKK